MVSSDLRGTEYLCAEKESSAPRHTTEASSEGLNTAGRPNCKMRSYELLGGEPKRKPRWPQAGRCLLDLTPEASVLLGFCQPDTN